VTQNYLAHPSWCCWAVASLTIEVFLYLFYYRVRPCVRRNFLNFSFLRVSEKFGCQSSEIFWKKLEFSNSQNFREKVWKKVWKFKFGKKFGNYSKMYVFESKKPCFWVKKLDKLRKFWKLGFPNVRKFRKLLFSKLSEIYEKMTLNSNFGNREKLILTRKPTQKFG